MAVRGRELITPIRSETAGMTSMLKAMTGAQPDCGVEGHSDSAGQTSRGLTSFQLVRRQLAMVPEGRGVFTRMTIDEKLLMGAYIRNDKAGIDDDIEKWYGVFRRLKERSTQLAGTLSGGEQQMLAM